MDNRDELLMEAAQHLESKLTLLGILNYLFILD